MKINNEKVSIVMMTPHMAREILVKNRDNRNQSAQAIRQLTTASRYTAFGDQVIEV